MTNVNQTTETSLISEILDSAAFSNRWRENFLNIVMRVTVAFGIVMFAVTLFQGDYRILTIYGVILLLLLVVTFAPVPYSIRAGVFTALIYLVGATILFGYGISADASTFLLAFIAITALLFDYRLGLTALALSIITMIIIDWMIASGSLKLLASSGTTGTVADWITYGLDMSAPGMVIILAVYFLKREFNKVLESIQGNISSFAGRSNSTGEAGH